MFPTPEADSGNTKLAMLPWKDPMREEMSLFNRERAYVASSAQPIYGKGFNLGVDNMGLLIFLIILPVFT